MSRYLFVTGKLAAQSLQDTAARLPADFEYEIAVLPITVAALMDTRFVAKHLDSTHGCDLIMIPGLCKGDLSIISDEFGIQALRGPKTLKDLPAFFGQENRLDGYGEHHVKILAEIVDAYQISLDEIMARARYYKGQGADIIDLGCPVEGNFPNVKAAVSMLKEHGFEVSLDTFNREDVLLANQAELDYLLSVNSKNIDLAPQLSCKVVVIPDFGQGLESLVHNIAQLQAWKVPYIIDPILEPISFGFSESLQRYYEMRRRYPEDPLMMGLGNLTELTSLDLSCNKLAELPSSLGRLTALQTLLTSTWARLVAIIGVIFLGFAWMFGRVSMHLALSVIGGIILVFGAPAIVDSISGSL